MVSRIRQPRPFEVAPVHFRHSGEWQPLDDATLAAWEGQGRRLPEEYRSFLMRFNGCNIRPYCIPCSDPRLGPENAGSLVVEVLYDWEYVLEKSEVSSGESRCKPPGFLVIGTTSAQWDILLGFEESNFGEIRVFPYEWDPDRYLSWMEELGSGIILASSFLEFLDLLVTRDYSSYWWAIDLEGEKGQTVEI